MATTTFSVAVRQGQKRRCSAKVRTGCGTCKARHVKCDEKKPFCDKCVTSGRTCPGYDVFRTVSATLTKHTFAISRSPSPLLPDASPQERILFDKFQSRIIGSFCGIFDGSWWSPYVLKAAVAEPMVLHAALAFSSIHGVSAAEDTFAIKQHHKAIKCLQAHLGNPDDLNPHLALLSTLLLACHGFAQNDSGQAILHLQGGAAVLPRIKDAFGTQDASGPTTLGAEGCIVNAFRQLDLATSLSMPTRSLPPWFSQWITKKTILLDNSQLDNLAALRNRLSRWTAEIVSLVQDVYQQRFGPPGSPLYRDDYPLQIRIQELLAASEQWLKAFNHVTSNVIPAMADVPERSSAERAASLLRMQHLVSSIILMTSLSDGHELVYDDHIEAFRTIMDIAEPLGPHFQNKGVSFTLDVCITPTLFYVATKCRDPQIRHRALDVLSLLNHREGAWDAQKSARAAARLVTIEEREAAKLASGKIPVHAADVPEQARVCNSFFDEGTGDILMYFERRMFEHDGSWLDWDERID